MKDNFILEKKLLTRSIINRRIIEKALIDQITSFNNFLKNFLFFSLGLINLILKNLKDIALMNKVIENLQFQFKSFGILFTMNSMMNRNENCLFLLQGHHVFLLMDLDQFE